MAEMFPIPAELDLTAEKDIDVVADFATALVDSMWSVDDLTAFRDRLVLRCQLEPVRMAQAFMVLATWQNPDETTSVRDQRADYLLASRRVAGLS